MTVHKMFAPGEVKLEESGTLVAAFAQLNVVDHDGDITRPGAFPDKDVPMSAYGHTSWEGALPVGRGTIEEKGDWAIFTGQFFMDTTHGRDAYATVKGLGELAEYSYGYDILDSGPTQVDDRDVLELRKLDVFEVSPVLRGAGVGTHTLAIKSGHPGSDAPYAELVDWYLSAVPALIERTDARIEMRAKEGRTLSAANVEALQAIKSAWLEHADAIDQFLADPESEKQANEVMVAIETARRLGVAV